MLITYSLAGRGREPGLGSYSSSNHATNTSLIAIPFFIGEPVSFRPRFTASLSAECHCGLHLSAGSSCSWPAGSTGEKHVQRVLTGDAAERLQFRRRTVLAILQF
jgi:hypothetical protein